MEKKRPERTIFGFLHEKFVVRISFGNKFDVGWAQNGRFHFLYGENG